MKKHKDLVIEDWETLGDRDKIYLQEEQDRMWRDEQYWEFIHSHQGRVVVEEDEDGEERKEIIINSSVLPF